MSRCAWPCSTRFSAREGPLSEPRRCSAPAAGAVVDETGERRRRRARRATASSPRSATGIDAPAGATVLDAKAAVVAPGLVDIQVHFREPGREDSETIETGARGAALGGFTAVVCMPNTDPPLDDAGGRAGGARTRAATRRATCASPGCITRGRARQGARAARRALRPRRARVHRRRRLRRRRGRDAARARVQHRAARAR